MKRTYIPKTDSPPKKLTFRQRYNISEDQKPHKRHCVYCGRSYSTISGRLCCRDCKKRTNEECSRIFDKRVEESRNEIS